MAAKSKSSSTATIKTPDKVTPYRQGRLDALETLLDTLDLLQAFNEWEQLQRQLRQGHAVKGA